MSGSRTASTLLAVVALAAGTWLAGCARTSAPPAQHTVVIDASAFTPSQLVVHAGDTVVWVNRDLVAHTATATSGRFDSQVIAPGKSWSWQPVDPGEVDYHCSLHPTMTATLTVD